MRCIVRGREEESLIMSSNAGSAAAAGTWKLGDLTVNRIGLGAMRLTGSVAFDPGTSGYRERSIAVLRRAVEFGVNHIDTAAFYFSADSSANDLINQALAPYPEDLVIATKVWPGRDSLGRWWWATPEQLRGQVEDNLRRLGRDRLDLVNLRIPPSAKTGSIAEHFGALADLRAAGLIRHLGISNATPEQLTEAQAIAPVVCVQNPYGIGASAEEQEFVRACGEQSVAFVPFFTIAGAGGARGAVGTDSDGIIAVARAHGATTAQVRLAWTLRQGPHMLVIPGTGNPDHLMENISAGALRLSDEEMARLSSPRQESE